MTELTTGRVQPGGHASSCGAGEESGMKPLPDVMGDTEQEGCVNTRVTFGPQQLGLPSAHHGVPQCVLHHGTTLASPRHRDWPLVV